MFFSLIYDKQTGAITGVHAYVESPSEYPADEAPCTQAQSEDWSGVEIDQSTTPPSVVSAPASTLLKNAQAAQLTKLYGTSADAANTSYLSSINQPVSFTTVGGVTQTYQADADSIANVQRMLNAFSGAGSLPSGFYWVAADNTQVPFTLADLQGLAKALGTQGWTAFQNLQTKKAAVMAATTVAAVQAVTW